MARNPVSAWRYVDALSSPKYFRSNAFTWGVRESAGFSPSMLIALSTIDVAIGRARASASASGWVQSVVGTVVAGVGVGVGAGTGTGVGVDVGVGVGAAVVVMTALRR